MHNTLNSRKQIRVHKEPGERDSDSVSEQSCCCHMLATWAKRYCGYKKYQKDFVRDIIIIESFSIDYLRAMFGKSLHGSKLNLHTSSTRHAVRSSRRSFQVQAAGGSERRSRKVRGKCFVTKDVRHSAQFTLYCLQAFCDLLCSSGAPSVCQLSSTSLQ